jgi:hypothetical protein
VSVKKAKGKGKGTAKKSANKSAKESTPRTKKPVDLVKVRENINNLVGASAEAIATGVITVAKTGQLASAKYLFEAVGLYPATEQTAARLVDNSLAHTLLTRMGLPLEPVVTDEDLAPAGLTSDGKDGAAEPIGVTEEALPGEGMEEQGAAGAEGKEQAAEHGERIP